jgi:hypothetical protein
VNGRLSDETGEPVVTIEEKRVIEEPKRGVWKLGTSTGRLTGADGMAGSGRNKSGEGYTWSLHR